jgi:hypothetical protein
MKIGLKILRLVLGWGWYSNGFPHQGKAWASRANKEGRTTTTCIGFAVIGPGRSSNLLLAIFCRATGRKGCCRHDDQE